MPLRFGATNQWENRPPSNTIKSHLSAKNSKSKPFRKTTTTSNIKIISVYIYEYTVYLLYTIYRYLHHIDMICIYIYMYNHISMVIWRFIGDFSHPKVSKHLQRCFAPRADGSLWPVFGRASALLIHGHHHREAAGGCGKRRWLVSVMW